MERVFADSGYWIAFLNPRDDLHQTARSVLRDLRPSQIVTTEMVLAEFLNSFSDYGATLRPPRQAQWLHPLRVPNRGCSPDE